MSIAVLVLRVPNVGRKPRSLRLLGRGQSRLLRGGYSGPPVEGHLGYPQEIPRFRLIWNGWT